jgi:hypothetical protein
VVFQFVDSEGEQDTKQEDAGGRGEDLEEARKACLGNVLVT